MRSMLQPEIREEVRRRLASVPADRAPLWGRHTDHHLRQFGA